MANKFLTNLRASRSTAQNTDISNKLPTRGDIQQQRQNNVDPNSFINFLRIVSGGVPVEKGKDQIGIESVPPHAMDKMSPSTVEEITEENYRKRWAAEQGSRYTENNVPQLEAATNGTLDVPFGRSDFYNAFGVLENYDALNKLLDQYDQIKTWAEKRKFLEDSYKKFDDKYGDISKWFNRLYGFTMEAQQYNEPYTKRVSDVMRELNENIKRRLLRNT